MLSIRDDIFSMATEIDEKTVLQGAWRSLKWLFEMENELPRPSVWKRKDSFELMQRSNSKNEYRIHITGN